jgi:endoglucanase
VEGLPIGFNFVGFHPDRIKRATAREPHESFTIRREDGTSAFEGQFEDPVPDAHTGGEAWIADFTELTEPGEYTFETDGLSDEQMEHARIYIAPDVFDDALSLAMMGLTGQRCGQAVSLSLDGATYSHGKCHLDDASLDHVDDGEGIRDGTGGWHDAGDYGKYTVNGAFAAGMMLIAWQHFSDRLETASFQVPEQNNDIPDFLDEVKWQVEWLLRMQREDGAAYHKITPYGENAWPGDVLPSDDMAQRYYARISSTGTADLVAVAAMAARIYDDYDSAFADRCREAAEAGYAFLTDHPEEIDPEDDAWLQRHYNSADDDERLWAAAEMWESFGSAEALADFESRAASATVSTNWDWPAVQNLGLFTYLLSLREDRDVRDPDVLAHVETALSTTADRIVSTSESHAYGVGYSGRPYWGINGIIVRMAMTLHVAHQLYDDTDYLDAAIQQLDHVLGRNLYGRSFVTALGVAPPMWPHHRPSVADGNRAPWPGLLVGGPHGEGLDEETDEDNDWRAWVDSSNHFTTNEVAINWNAALVYALAATYDG